MPVDVEVCIYPALQLRGSELVKFEVFASEHICTALKICLLPFHSQKSILSKLCLPFATRTL